MKKVWILLLSLISLVYITPKTLAAENIDYEDLFANHQSVMLIIQPVTGEIYFANQAAVEFYGYPLEILLGMNINEINTLTPKEVEAERLKALNEERNFFIFKHLLANGDIKTVHVYSYPIEISDETYLFSIIIDQTEYALLQNRQRISNMIIISLLILATITTTTGFLIVNQNKKHLKESVQRIEALLDTSFSGIAIHNQGIFLDCNKKLCDITGYSYEELMNMDGLLLITPEQRDFIASQIESGYELPYETQGLRKNGEIYPARIESRNISYRGKQVLVTEYRDITELKKQEGKLKESENQYRLLTEKMQLGLSLNEIICDENEKPIDFRFISVNAAWEQVMGVKKEVVLGKRVMEVFPHTEHYWIEKFGQVALTGESMSYENYSKDLERHFSFSIYSPKKGQFAVVIEDVSERVQSQQKINQYLERYRLVSAISNTGVWEYNLEKNYLWGSPEYFSMLGRNQKDYPMKPNNIKETWYDLIHPDDIHEASAHFSDYLKEKPNKLYENFFRLKVANGDYRWIWSRGSFIYDEKGNATNAVIGTHIDITDQKHYEDNIIYASKHDFLTGLPNRRYFDEKIKELDKPVNYPLLIAMIDLDGLKLINDTYGHKIGDQSIIKTAGLLKDCFADSAFIARVGGDEFLMISPKTTMESFKQKREALYNKMKDTKIKNIQLSLSLGVEVKINASKDIDHVIMNAENNMYANKVLHGQSSRSQTIKSIFETLKEKHEEERNHSDQVGQYCALMGEKMRLSDSEKLELEFAGRMHDIGKITIPDHILKKPGKLTDDEWIIMKSHTTNGYQILRSADHYSRLADYALTHHERIDGKGYPQGLKGDAIPLFSRIISICDAYEAMTADRPYRKAMTHKEAIDEIVRYSGTQFDPQLVEVFISLFESKVIDNS
ncbi:HD domain-containing phosphohydrolase [Liberiplasma polymorphum]|uniref:HD domain-containing phosphohydrolase n=1 Tax=Liberiplasma polymorphum TaxID=3374570 RepID=UPI0037733E6E